MIIDSATGWIDGVRRVVSPNSDERPSGAELDLIVVHGISLPPGQFGNGWVDRFFCNDLPADVDPYFATISHLAVSAHVLIARDGELTQVPTFSVPAKLRPVVLLQDRPRSALPEYAALKLTRFTKLSAPEQQRVRDGDEPALFYLPVDKLKYGLAQENAVDLNSLVRVHRSAIVTRPVGYLDTNEVDVLGRRLAAFLDIDLEPAIRDGVIERWQKLVAAQQQRRGAPELEFIPSGELGLLLTPTQDPVPLQSPEGCAFDEVPAEGGMTIGAADTECRAALGGYATSINVAATRFVSEPLPVEHGTGDDVRSGAVNSAGPFSLRATADAASSNTRVRTYAGELEPAVERRVGLVAFQRACRTGDRQELIGDPLPQLRRPQLEHRTLEVGHLACSGLRDHADAVHPGDLDAGGRPGHEPAHVRVVAK